MKCWLLVRWEPQMSTKQVITQVPWTLSENTKWDLPRCGWCVCMWVSLHLPSLPPPTFSFLLTFTSEDDTQSNCDLSLNAVWLAIFFFIANMQKLSADWQSIHYLLNLSGCVILCNAFAPKSHLSLTVTAVSAAISLQELEERKRMKTVSLGISGFNNSLVTLSWILL